MPAKPTMRPAQVREGAVLIDQLKTLVREAGFIVGG
jgi:hypothetical protein